MDARDALLQRITARMVRTREALEQFNDVTAERMPISSRWNVRDLVAHLAHWVDEAAGQVPLLAAGAAPKEYNLDRINDEVYRANRRMSFVMLLPRLRAAEDRFLAAVRAVKPELLVSETPVRQAIEQAGIKHYDAHWPDLREAAENLK